LVLVWMLFLPRRWRIVCFSIVTPWELGVIFTANYTFLNYLVLALGVLLLDDDFLLRFLPGGWKKSFAAAATTANKQTETSGGFRHQLKIAKLSLIGFVFAWMFYATVAELIWMVAPLPVPTSPVVVLEPFRIANRYGLFAVMTRGRYEIEFQGSDDGKAWVAYPFRYKPQDPGKPPGIYAPYQPRFDWNLWFASLGSWREYPIVPRTELRLLSNDSDVLSLFKQNPFPQKPPRQVRAVLWQYWFTSMAEKGGQDLWWRRQFLGLYAPTIERDSDGNIREVEMPNVQPRQ
jgi:lipase maturation factor 1